MRKTILAILLLLPAGLAHAGVSEADIRDEIRQKGYTLFLADRFEELDRLADDYRINKSRTPSGVWKLDKLHKCAKCGANMTPEVECCECSQVFP